MLKKSFNVNPSTLLWSVAFAVVDSFTDAVFQHCPTLTDHANNVDKILESWREYKMAVPTYGAIILDPTLKNVCMSGFVSSGGLRHSWALCNHRMVGGGAVENVCIHCAIYSVSHLSRLQLLFNEYELYKMPNYFFFVEFQDHSV